MKLTGQKLADRYAEVYASEVTKVSGIEARKYIWATYIGGGWVELRGESVPSHKDLREVYPNGWSLLDRKRSSVVRNYISTKETQA